MKYFRGENMFKMLCTFLVLITKHCEGSYRNSLEDVRTSIEQQPDCLCCIDDEEGILNILYDMIKNYIVYTISI